MKLRLFAAATITVASATAIAEQPDSATIEQELMRAFEAQRPALNACNEVAEVSTTVQVKFAISPDGSVEILDASAEDEAPRAVACVREVFANASYEGLPIDRPLAVTQSHGVRKPSKLDPVDLFEE